MYTLLFGIACCLFAFSDAGLHCKHNIIPVGCYNDDWVDRALNQQLLNERDDYSHVWGGRWINWKDPDYFTGFVCRCAQKTVEHGFTHFGIQFFGECWSGNNAVLNFHKHKESTNCKYFKPPKYGCPIGIGKQLTSYVYEIASYNKECPVEISPLGCFADYHTTPRPLPFYTMNERDNTLANFDGHWIQWKDWNNYLPLLVCRCANAAAKIGHDIFGIQFYGECWTGLQSDGKTNYSINGASQNCGGKQVGGKKIMPCSSQLKCFGDYCAGRHLANFVYKITNTHQASPTVEKVTPTPEGGASDADEVHILRNKDAARKYAMRYGNKQFFRDAKEQEQPLNFGRLAGDDHMRKNLHDSLYKKEYVSMAERMRKMKPHLASKDEEYKNEQMKKQMADHEEELLSMDENDYE